MTRIPYTDGLLLVPVVVQHPTAKSSLSLQFYVDTGASTTVIRRDHRKRLALPFRATVPVQTGAGRVEMPTYRAEILFQGRRLPALLLSPGVPLPYDGLLGRDVIDSYHMCFDGGERQIIVAAAGGSMAGARASPRIG